ncbi:type II toxin-antitoxin system HipA family toxin [Desulfobacula toluolica]|uniref:HipA: protein predicted to be involced in cell division n=1 Tax=Desulfobacula toluolica (strain DSM 7467 / Tol2) TaxID=651182 RepID=K0NDV4_DESTT|nr:type II toxin-antitoxin system HipA family toxin [Desulfobacula toluolica]CCK79076.1 HipA: protein predicted to be involced in cell division [Desulfobacula toluolica Tol2]
MIWLDVNITLPDNTTINCGEIVTREPDKKGIIPGAFQYTREYLEHPKAFPLDPVTLPLRQEEFTVQRPEGIHAVFEDALPDNWGRKILIQKAGLPRSEQRPPNLLGVLGANGLGALSFAPKGQITHINQPADIVSLPDLLEAALRYDAGLPVNEKQLKLLFVHGSSPGGARPKTLVQREPGYLCLAKFPKHDDSFCVERIEAGCLEMARLSGLDVPDFEIREVGGRNILLIKRFDISEHGGRYHMISMQTLLQAEGYYQLGYKDLFEILRKYSFQPSVDIPMLFRQMTFNAAIGNTDDHLKNFCILHKEPGFCLSPAYDVLPDLYERREHVLSFPMGSGQLPPNRLTLQQIGKKLKIPRTEGIIDDVLSAVSKWKEIFQQYRVPEFDIQRLEWGIQRRLSALEKPADIPEK